MSQLSIVFDVDMLSGYFLQRAQQNGGFSVWEDLRVCSVNALEYPKIEASQVTRPPCLSFDAIKVRLADCLPSKRVKGLSAAESAGN